MAGVVTAVAAIATKTLAVAGISTISTFSAAGTITSIGLVGISVGRLITTALTISSLAGGSLFGKKKNKGLSGFEAAPRDRMIRQPISSHKIVYGKAKVSGPLTFVESTDDNNFLHLVIPLAGHEVESIDDVFMDMSEQYVASDGSVPTTGSNPAIPTNSDLEDLIRFYKKTGSSSQTAITALVNATSKWTTAHRGRGIAYIYARLKHNRDVFTAGVPNISAEVRGAKVYDTRTSTTAYSTNPALCLYDYLTSTKYGLGIPTSQIDTTSFNTAANVCEESVTLKGGGTENRYDCNGVLDTANSPIDNLKSILASMSGYLVYSNGTFKVYAGEYRTPTVTLTEDDLRGPMQVVPKLSKRDSFNSVRGLYISEDNGWQPSDFPPVTNSTYVTEDNNEEIWLDMQQEMVTSPSQCQRLAKIELEKNRQQISVNMTCGLDAFELDVGDTVQLTNSRMGWTNKVFEVTSWNFSTDDGDLAIDLSLRETASTVYDWNESTEENEVDPAPNTNLPNANAVAALTGLTLSSGTDELILHKDGTISSRIKVLWTASTDAFVIEGGDILVQYKKSSETTWQTWGYVPGTSNFVYINDVEDGVNYDVRVRARNSIGRNSSYTTSSNHTVVGKTEPPANITVFYASQADDAVQFNWNEVTDADLAGYEIRYGPQGNVTWSAGITLNKATRGTHSVGLNVPPGSWTMLIKAIDTTGNFSKRVASFDITVDNNNTIIEYQADEEFSTGTLVNFVKHYTGVLVPDSQLLASNSGFGTFDNYVPTPYVTCTYTSTEKDLGTSTAHRVWTVVSGSLGPDVNTGNFNARTQLFHRKSTDPSGLFEAANDNTKNTSGGTLTNLVRHYTGVLVPDSQDLASVSGWDTFDQFVPNPYENCSYEVAEVDAGSDRTITLTETSIVEAGPGETGYNEETHSFDYRLAAGSYDGFENISGPRQVQARYFKTKIAFNTKGGVPKVTSYTTTFDPFVDWQLGTFTGRYVTARVIMDTDTGLSKYTNIQITADR